MFIYRGLEIDVMEESRSISFIVRTQGYGFSTIYDRISLDYIKGISSKGISSDPKEFVLGLAKKYADLKLENKEEEFDAIIDSYPQEFWMPCGDCNGYHENNEDCPYY